MLQHFPNAKSTETFLLENVNFGKVLVVKQHVTNNITDRAVIVVVGVPDKKMHRFKSACFYFSCSLTFMFRSSGALQFK